MSLKSRAAKRLRSIANKLDPPGAAQEKRHHPAIKNPGEPQMPGQPEGFGPVAQNPQGYVYSDVVPGRWGGPYL